MKKKILRIVLILSYGMLVSSNNGYPVIPTQTYPIYQQNGYSNPYSNQPSDITSYLQNLMVQNQSPSLNLSPSNIRQILLNRILSNQPIQTNFDQNSIGYGSKLVEYNNLLAANPVSNYVNIPPNGANKEDKTADIKIEEKRKKNKKRKVSKSRRKHDKSEKDQTTWNTNEINNIQDKDREISKKHKKRSRKPKTEDSFNNKDIKNYEVESNRKTKKKKRKNKENEVQNPINKETGDETPKPRRRRKKKPKLDTDNTEKVVTEQQTTQKPYQIQEGLNLANFNEGIVEENRVPRNPIPDENHLLKPIPNLPENIANSFNIKGMPQFNNPTMSNFFGNYENLYQSMMSNSKGVVNNQREIIKKRPQKPRTNNKRKTEVKNRNSTTTTEATASTSSKPVTTKINVVTTEKTIIIKEKTRTNIDPVPKEESLKSIDKSTDVNETTKHEFEKAEYVNVKDFEPNMNDNYSNEYIDDYYPQFTDSAAYTANNREVYVKNLGDTKYYYAVDKGNPDFINRMRFEGFGLPNNVAKYVEVNKTYDDAEKEGAKNDLNTDFEDREIQFRSPPHLELPDFQTKQVGRTKSNLESYSHFDENSDFEPRFPEDKASIYSEAKTPHYTGTKENSKKDELKHLETVFARSKVANYGPVYNPEEDTSSNLNDGGTTYVFATSLDYPELS